MFYPTLFFRSYRFIIYLIKAKGPHSLHSPFLFKLYREVIAPSRSYKIHAIEEIRNQLLGDKRPIEILDFKNGDTHLTTIGQRTKSSSSRIQFSAFMNLLIKYLKCESVLETGTNMGLNTLYLADAANQVATIEGSGTLSTIAQKNFNLGSQHHINLVTGDLYQELEKTIVKNQPDFYFIDADHRSSAIAFCLDIILRHTPEVKCIVIHDIYWSKDMFEMWCQLTQDPRFTLTIDIYQAGILFPNLTMEKQAVSLRF